MEKICPIATPLRTIAPCLVVLVKADQCEGPVATSDGKLNLEKPEEFAEDLSDQVW